MVYPHLLLGSSWSRLPSSFSGRSRFERRYTDFIDSVRLVPGIRLRVRATSHSWWIDAFLVTLLGPISDAALHNVAR